MNMILVLDNLMFVINDGYPLEPTSNTNKNLKDAYNNWVQANDKTCYYLLTT